MLARLPIAWRNFLRDNAYTGISTVLTQITGVLFSALFARRSSEDFAFYQYILSIVGLLSIFSFPGLTQSLKIEISRGAYPLNQFFKAKLKYGLLATAAALVAASVFYLIEQTQVALALLLIAPLLPLYYALPLYSTALEGKLQFDLSALLKVITAVTMNLVLVILLLLKGSALFISLAFFLLNIGLDSLAFYYLQHRNPNDPLPPEQFSQALTYARNLTFVSSLGIVRQNVDRFIVGSFLPPASLAIYAIAASLAQQIRLLSNTISQTIFPRIAALAEGKARIVIQRQFWRWILFTAGVCLVAIALARPYIILIYGKTYIEAVSLSYILILIMGLGMLAMPLGIFFESQRRADVIYRTNAVASILEIGLILLLVPFFQLTGVLWSKTLARTYLLAAFIYLFGFSKN